jgi:recombination protein RecT
MANQRPAQVQQFGKALTAETTMKRLRNSIPKGVGVTAEQIASVVMSQVRQNPDLVTKCNHDSLMAACFDVAKSGLVPDGILGQAYIVPFKGQAQFIPGYRGLITLAMNSGMVSEIWAKEVRQSDHFVVHEGTKHEIEHHVDYTKSRKQRGEIIAVYACAHLRHGGKVFEIMPADEVEEIRRQAPGANSPAWKNHWPEMAKKTALRRLAKWLPQSVQRYTQMEEHFEATGEVTHLNDDMTIEASKSDYSEVPTEDQSQEQPAQQQEPQPQEQPAQSGGQGQGHKKQSSRARAAVGESKKKSNGSGQSKQQRQPQAQANDQQPAQEAAEEPTPAEEDQPADSTPHDPETGEVIEATAEEVPWDNDVGGDEGADEDRGESQEEEQSDVEGVDMPYGKRGPDIDGWFNKVIEKLNSYTHPHQVERFRANCKPQIDMLGNMSKSTADEAHKLFDDRIQELNEDGSSPI